MRIVQINSVCDIGSTGRIAADLCRKAQREGHEVIMAYGRGNKVPNDLKTLKIGTGIDLILHGLLSRLFDMHGFGSVRATKEFLKELDTFKPDIIHLHNIHGYYLNIELLFDYIKRNDIETYWTLHDCWAFTGHCSFAGEEIGCNKWKTGCGDCPMKKEYPVSLIMDQSKKNFKRKKAIFQGVRKLTLITPSEWLATMTRESFLKEYPVVVERNTIDKESFKETFSDVRERYNLQDKFVILCVGFAWDRWKYNDLMTLAMRLNENEKMILVGIDEKQIKELPQNVIGIKRTNSKKELAEIYTMADVFINPTYSDNYPTVNLEAEACGTPVICYDTGGCKETLNREDSLCVPKGNVEEMVKKIRILEENKKRM